MKRRLQVGLGIAASVVALRGARVATERAVPAAARAALGAVAQVTTVAQRMRREFAAGTAEREAELRGDLLAGADLTRSRQVVDAWRARRAASGTGTGSGPDDGADPTARPTAAGPLTRRARRSASGSHRLEDPDDGPIGYSFF